MAKILVIDDEPSIRSVLRDILEMENYDVEEAKDGIDALSKVKKTKFDAAICDIKMPKMDGMELLERINILSPDTPVIMISGHGNIETAVEAVKKGAFDYISKPPDLNRLLITIRNALDKSSLVQETKVLKKKIKKSGGVQTIIGESEGIAKIKATIDRVAPTDARVLVTGPNGTGKELVARWIHEKSERAQNQIVEVNCAAIPAELIESELFGHEKGSFTSAHKQRIGKFEQAHGGTLFLDEIGDMSLSAQAKVLRALQEGRITRVGGDKDIKVDVRVIAATNKDLRKEIDGKRFREDLYHRLAVIIIQVPSLNDRKSDIPLLVDHFIESVCNEYGRPKKEIEEGAIQLLQEVDWTGNIRELRNVIERLIILSEQNITLADVENFVLPTMKRHDQLKNLFDKFENEAAVQKFVAGEYQKYNEIKD
ncbi:MAG: Sigma-54 dependent transcriptional regulator/response regulator [uncultured Aureispira sp.]|uniref:Sigma-54 dependent transcriptional regulator/response regulator n=1 Tax=uncultured Aureispira sp. TaxID=1331704 RepID=A0A6S6RXX7_9BACT|nr:MAG: Sigma-54 dependent transcriptional regulator/response regulator [uncultured Aureispira sp.]